MDWKKPLVCTAIATTKGLRFLSAQLLILLALIVKFIIFRAIPGIWRTLRDTVFPVLHVLYMRLPHRRIVAVCAVSLATIAVGVLMMRTPGPIQDAADAAVEPVVLTFSPAEAAPGAPIIVSGLPAENHERFALTVGGLPAAAQRLPDGTIRALVPLYLGPGNWPDPPASAQKVEILREGHPLAVSREGLRVTELKRAPGTTMNVQRSLEQITDGYERMFDSLPVQNENERRHRKAVVAVLRGLVSEGDKSLAAVLAGTSSWLKGETPDVELIDAVLASSGAADYLEAYGAAMAADLTNAGNQPRTSLAVARVPMVGLSAGMGMGMGGFALAPVTTGASSAGGARAIPGSVGTSSSGPRCRRGGEDFEIACLMQMQGLLTDLSQGFVKPTAETYANTMGLAMTATGAGAITHSIVSALLAVANVVMEKVVPSLFPASLSKFEMRVSKSIIDVQESTKATITIAARNNPQTITFLDLLDIVKSTMGPFVKFPDKYHETLKNAFEFTLDLYLYTLKATGQTPLFEHDVFTMPPMVWGPTTVRSDDLVSMFSYEPGVVSPQEQGLSWRGDSSGQAKVRVMPRGPGPRSKVLKDHSMCPGCVWSGGAFGTDMPESSQSIAVGLKLDALPRHGRAPLRVHFRWELLPLQDQQPVPCSLDFGDGSPVERFADCSKTRSFTYEYPYTSRLNDAAGGAFVATLARDGSRAQATAEVFPDWEFSAHHTAGKTPLDNTFSWDIPWTPDEKAPRCEFDPGDGSPRQKFDNCLTKRKATHRFERGGSFVPTLTVIHGGAKDTKTAPVSVAADAACEGLLEHKAWTGTVSYRQQRDAWNKTGSRNVKYSMVVNLGAELAERTRREHKGVEYLVQYYSPLPHGSANLNFRSAEYGGSGNLQASDRFSGTGPMQRQEPDMAEDGSMLTLTLNAGSCTYAFYLQGQVMGSGETSRWGGRKESYRGHVKIHSVRGEGVVSSATAISGSAPFPVLAPSQIHDNGFEKASWVSEYGSVASALGETNLGKVTVTWHFEPKD